MRIFWAHEYRAPGLERSRREGLLAVSGLDRVGHDRAVEGLRQLPGQPAAAQLQSFERWRDQREILRLTAARCATRRQWRRRQECVRQSPGRGPDVTGERADA